MMNGLYVMQRGQLYSFYTPQGILIAAVYTGADGQFMKDAVALNKISRILAERWNIPKKSD